MGMGCCPDMAVVGIMPFSPTALPFPACRRVSVPGKCEVGWQAVIFTGFATYLFTQRENSHRCAPFLQHQHTTCVGTVPKVALHKRRSCQKRCSI